MSTLLPNSPPNSAIPDSALPHVSDCDPRDDIRWTADNLKQIDTICEQFEAAWKAGTPLEIRQLLQQSKSAMETLLFRELLAIDVEYRQRQGQGQSLTVTDLLRSFPEYANIVRLVCSQTLPVVSDDTIPEMLAKHPRYEVTGRLGMGGMGTVFAGRHMVLGRDVAIKVIRNEYLASPAARERFLREAQTAARLQHPNVVTVYDAEATDAGQFLVMEAVSGADLARTVDENGPLPWEAACDAIQQAAAGLEAARQIGLVHRDLSPRNLMLSDDGTVKLLDFGLASLSAGVSDPSLIPGMLVGSVPFMAPEQASDPSASDVRSDLYGLGCVMFFLLTGKPPYAGGTLPEVLEAHRRHPIPDVCEFSSEIPTAVALIVSRLLAKAPADRYQTPSELAEDLDRVIKGESPLPTIKTPEPVVPVTAAKSPRKSGRLFLVVIGILLIATAFAFGFRQLGGKGGQPTVDDSAFVQGRSLLDQRQERQVRLAILKFQDVIARQPKHARAYAALADSYNLLGDYGWEPAMTVFPKAIAAAHRSLELEPDLAEGCLALAFAAATYTCDWDEADRQYRRALEIAPNLPSAHHWYAWYLLQRRRFDEALVEIQRAHELAPENLIILSNVGKILYFGRKYPAAVERHRAALELDQDFQKGHMDLGYTLIELNRIDEALSEFDRAVGISSHDLDVKAARAYALARQGNKEAAQELLKTLQAEAERVGLFVEMAHIYTALGDSDQAIRWLEKAFARKSPGRADVRVDPRLDPLRKDYRFAPLLKTIGIDD